ncbi:SCAN domain-containing protein 3-like [Penaeus chinensis]|uniref:SCAN domain-containing protein 3-like n=1 Tax=Penaeus chinensis TaxID=139456 RepID=UPI001FB61CF8|nr:SCAN domain-containing protein 3-like [Penaeus chinensis]
MDGYPVIVRVLYVYESIADSCLKAYRRSCSLTAIMDRWLKRDSCCSCSGDADEGNQTGAKKKKTDLPKYRQFKEDYVLLGFTATNSDPPEALCFFCGERLANSSMKPAHLQRHQKTKHQCHVGKPAEFFKRKLSDFQGSQKVLQKATTTSEKALKASLAVSLLIAKAKKPFSIAEELILPAAGMMAEIMLDKKTADQLKAVPLSLSHQTVSRRVSEMSAYIQDQVVNKLKASQSFSLQVDESTDISGQAQLVSFVRYIDEDDIKEHILFCKKMEEHTTGEAIFNVINQFFTEQGLGWKSCMSMCTDAAASMTGKVKGLVARIKKENPDVEWTHCIIHRESLASKKMSSQLHEILNDAVKNATFFENTTWVAQVAYLTDIFSKLNELNMSLQGKDTNILNLYDKVAGFQKKLGLWKEKCSGGYFTCFPLSDAYFSDNNYEKDTVKPVIVEHLTNLISAFKSYFPGIHEQSVQLDWIRNPFLLSEPLQETLIEVCADRGLKLLFERSNVTRFWSSVKKEHPDLGKLALEKLLPFGSTYLSEVSFFAMSVIKSKQRNKLNVNLEQSLITAVASIQPRMEKIISEHQPHISH